jgi:erythromycin esterase
MKSFLYLSLTLCAFTSEGQTSTSLTSEWQKLQHQIDNSLIVGVGEVVHGFESLNKNKAGLVDFLHKESNFRAIALESSFTESIISYLNNDSADDRAKNFLYPFWITASVRSVLRSFIEDEKGLAKPLVVGFDIQEDCRFDKLSEFLREEGLITANLMALHACDSILSRYIGKNVTSKGAMTNQEYLALISTYDLVKAELETKDLDTFPKKLLLRCLENRKWLCKFLTLSTTRQKMYFRDSLMAANIVWLQKEIYTDNKFIIWAANTHISKLAKGSKPQWTGEWLSSIYTDKYFAISFQKGSAKNKHNWQNTSFQYTVNNNKTFDCIFYVSELKKIESHEWITPCE